MASVQDVTMEGPKSKLIEAKQVRSWLSEVSRIYLTVLMLNFL